MKKNEVSMAKVRLRQYEKYREMIYNIEQCVHGDPQQMSELSIARERLAYVYTEYPGSLDRDIDEAIGTLVNLMRFNNLVRSDYIPSVAHDSITRAELVHFMIHKYCYYNMLSVYVSLLQSEIGTNLDAAKESIRTTTYFLLPRILFFVGLEPEADRFARDIITKELDTDWQKSIFTDLEQNSYGGSIKSDALVDSYFEQAFDHIRNDRCTQE